MQLGLRALYSESVLWLRPTPDLPARKILEDSSKEDPFCGKKDVLEASVYMAFVGICNQNLQEQELWDLYMPTLGSRAPQVSVKSSLKTGINTL